MRARRPQRRADISSADHFFGTRSGIAANGSIMRAA